MQNQEIRFSILIPTWNNLECLRLCIAHLREYSRYSHEILVYVNEGIDGTTEWLKQENIKYIQSDVNDGICIAMNALAKIATNEYLVYINDDMMVLPDWDFELIEVIKQYSHTDFFLSSTTIEPNASTNPNLPIQVANFGNSAENFDNLGLLQVYENLKTVDWNGASWPLNVIHRKWWDRAGGYSLEFSPGFYSDPDFSMKLWQNGMRDFRGVGKSLVYHFGSKSTKKVKKKNKGREEFIKKWKISANDFYSYYLKMGSLYAGPLKDPKLPIGFRIKSFFRKIWSIFVS